MGKKIVKIILIIILSIVLLLALLFAALTLPAVQQWIKNVALKELTAKINSKITIDNIYIRFPNSLNITNIYVEDQSADTLLFAENLNAKFNLLPLLKKELLINEINFSDFHANITQDSLNAPMNFQFIIDAFASEDTTEKEPSQLRINLEKIRLKNGRASYHVKSEPDTPEAFNANHINVSNLNSDISLDYVDLEKFNLRVKKLSLKEASGIELNNISLNTNGNGKIISVKDFQLMLPNSIVEADAEINYQGFELEDIATKSNVALTIKKSSVLLSDVKAFSPTLSNFTEPINIQGKIEGKLPSINLNELNLSMGELLLDATASITDYNNIENTFFQANINKLEANEKSITKLSKNITGEAITLPEQVKRLGNISLTGNISGELKNLLLALHLSSNPGSVSLNGTVGYVTENEKINYNVRYQTQNFQLNRLLNDNTFGRLSVRGFLSGHYVNETIYADAKAFLSEFGYDNMNINNTEIQATVNNNVYDVILNMNNDLGYLNLNANAVQVKSNQYDIKMAANAKQLALSKFIELENFPNSKLNLSINADAAGSSIDNLIAQVLLDSIAIQSEEQNFSTTAVTLKAGFEENGKRFFSLNHRLIKALLRGKVTFETLPAQLTNTMNAYFPALIAANANKKSKLITNKNDFTLYVTCGNTEELTKAFNLPYTITKNTNLAFSYNDNGNLVRVGVNSPESKVGETILTNITLALSNETGPIKLFALGELPDSIKVQVNGTAEQNKIILNTTFDNKCDTFPLNGHLNNQVLLERASAKEPLKTTVLFDASDLLFNTLELKIKPSEIVLFEEKIHVNNFQINHEDHSNEFILANGTYSSTKQDTLRVQINNLEISDITDAINMSHYGLSGLIDGRIAVVGTEKIPNLFANPLSINNIFLNKEEIGNLNIRSAWSDERNIILVSGALERKDGAENSTIRGRIRTTNDSLSVNVNLKDIKLAWLQPFLEGVLHSIDGNINTDLTISGTLNAPQVNGIAYVEEGKFGIDFTNVTYTINDSIFIRPNEIDIQNLGITDNNGNSANLNCKVAHKNFTDLSYDFSVRMQDFLVLNTMTQKDSLFYGLVRLSGNIDGKGDKLGIGVNMRLQDSNNSKIAVIIPSTLTAQENQSIIFVDHRTEEERLAEKEEKEARDLPINLRIGLTISPQMEFTVFLDQSQKNRAIVTGAGNVDFSYNMNSSEMNLLGNYEIQKGEFTLSLQNIAQRRFQILEGSEVKFNGDPLRTSFDVKAQYSLRADLTTLDQSFANDVNLQSSTRVDVNCILTIKGDLNKIDIAYDIELPNAQQDVQQSVRAYMNSEDILIKEFAYLLAIGSFYSPDFATASSSGNSIVNSIAASTLSSTLNNLVSGVLGDNISLNTNVNSIDNNNVDVDLTLSTRWFNDRLIINTNVEYNNASTTNDNFGFGDFDAELKLNKTGTLRLKAYNKTNDQYYQKAPMTQGVGFVYTKEATRFKQLFQTQKRRYRREEK